MLHSSSWSKDQKSPAINYAEVETLKLQMLTT